MLYSNTNAAEYSVSHFEKMRNTKKEKSISRFGGFLFEMGSAYCLWQDWRLFCGTEKKKTLAFAFNLLKPMCVCAFLSRQTRLACQTLHQLAFFWYLTCHCNICKLMYKSLEIKYFTQILTMMTWPHSLFDCVNRSGRIYLFLLEFTFKHIMKRVRRFFTICKRHRIFNK